MTNPAIRSDSCCAASRIQNIRFLETVLASNSSCVRISEIRKKIIGKTFAVSPEYTRQKNTRFHKGKRVLQFGRFEKNRYRNRLAL